MKAEIQDERPNDAQREAEAEVSMDDARSEDHAVRWRDVILKAHPDVVPEMVQGDSLNALLDSVEPARAAFASLVERLESQQRISKLANGKTVPAGGSAAPGIDLDSLPPSEMLRRGLGKMR